MVKKKILLSCAVLLSYFSLIAQEKDTRWIGLETDPISTVFGAKTLSVIVEPTTIQHWSLFVNIVNADFPDWMDDFLNPNNKGKGFASKINIGGGFAVDYFLNEEREGIYFGLINLIFQNEVSRNTESRTILTHNVVPRVGYRWYPFQQFNFYVNPFLGVRYEYGLEKPQTIDGQEFLPVGIQPFGTIHIGYHF